MPVKRVSQKAGLPPGALVHVGEKKLESAKITLIKYDNEHYEKKEYSSIEDCLSEKKDGRISWINIDGLHDEKLIERLGGHFGIHSLVLEDILHTGQRPKAEFYDGYLVVFLRMIYFDETENTTNTEQVSIILTSSGYVLTFQEVSGDIFDPVRNRIERSLGRIRNRGADYLAYVLMDAVVDNYFIILDQIGGIIDELEEEFVNEPSKQTLSSIYNIKKELLHLSRYIRPVRELSASLIRVESNLITSSTQPFLRDLYDHVIHVIDMIDIFRELVTEMINSYLSLTSNRLNEIMKVLTIMASIFIPLTFIAGVYGMNFEVMPELEWKIGYPLVLSFMLAVALALLYYFRRKHWI